MGLNKHIWHKGILSTFLSLSTIISQTKRSQRGKTFSKVALSLKPKIHYRYTIERKSELLVCSTSFQMWAEGLSPYFWSRDFCSWTFDIIQVKKTFCFQDFCFQEDFCSRTFVPKRTFGAHRTLVPHFFYSTIKSLGNESLSAQMWYH